MMMIIIIIIMTEVGLEFFAIQSLYGLCSEVPPRLVFLSNNF